MHFSGEDMTDKTNPKDLEGNKKPPISLVPASVIIHLAQAFKEGARKYGPYNWRKNKVQAMIYLDAAMRHILAKLDGEDTDPESGKDHLDGALASLAVYLDAQESGNLVDNRPPKGPGAELIRSLSSNTEITQKKSCWDQVDHDEYLGKDPLQDPNRPFEQQNVTGYNHDK